MRIARYSFGGQVSYGVVEGGDPEAQAQIEDWCRAAQVRRNHTRNAARADDLPPPQGEDAP